jgi:hypothetical protein
MFAIRAFGSFFTVGALDLSLATVMGAEQKPERGNAAERGKGARKAGGCASPRTPIVRNWAGSW